MTPAPTPSDLSGWREQMARATGKPRVTRRDAAAMLNTPPATYYGWEQGRTTPPSVTRVAMDLLLARALFGAPTPPPPGEDQQD